MVLVGLPRVELANELVLVEFRKGLKVEEESIAMCSRRVLGSFRKLRENEVVRKTCSSFRVRVGEIASASSARAG